MINICILSFLFELTVVPQNPMFDKYVIIPPIGHVKAITTTPLLVCAISDANCILFDKFDLEIEKTFYFDEEPLLIGYDPFSSDLWVATTNHLVRITLSSYSIRIYNSIKGVIRFCIDEEYIYLDGNEDRAFNKRTGALELVQGFPGRTIWYAKTTAGEIKRYSFLSPYFYSDELDRSDTPFTRYPITAVHEDGMDLYVGTNGYGILKYNTVSWDKKRIIYGPLDLEIFGVRSSADQLFFISRHGISYYLPDTRSWEYQRISHTAQDVLIHEDNIMVGIEDRLSTWDSGVLVTISTLPKRILTLAHDDSCMYIGTNSGMFKLYSGTHEPIEFGPDRFPVYAIHVLDDYIYAGGELALYAFDRTHRAWSEVLPFGIKNITRLDNQLYLLSRNNQLLYYNIPDSASVTDTPWIMLPYFNIYDIAADSEVVYCASYAGAHYYEPNTRQYRVIYNLPRLKYQYIYVAKDRILAVTDKALYSLPIRYRD
jgi:hypothetical protein